MRTTIFFFLGVICILSMSQTSKPQQKFKRSVYYIGSSKDFGPLAKGADFYEVISSDGEVHVAVVSMEKNYSVAISK